MCAPTRSYGHLDKARADRGIEVAHGGLSEIRPGDAAGEPRRLRDDQGAEERRGQIRSRDVRFLRAEGRQPGLQGDGARTQVRRRRTGDRHVPGSEDLRQAGDAAAGRRDGALPAPVRAALDRARTARAGRDRGQAHRHPLLHADHRHLGARDLPARIRRRPEQGDVGVQRRRTSGRIQGPAERRAHAGRRQEGRPDAARRRDRWRDPRRGNPRRAARRASDSRTRARRRWPGTANTARSRSTT